MNREEAKTTLTAMKGKRYKVSDRIEVFQSFSIHPTGSRVLITTDHQTRETNLRDLHLHLDIYEEKLPKNATVKTMAAISTVVEEPVKPSGPVKVNLPAHVGESSDRIHFTTDYTLFNRIEGNRVLNHKKINRIIKEIEQGTNLLPFCPIIVDAQFNIVDGQHRFEVCQQISSPVWFVITRKITLHEIAKVNSNQERWKSSDFIHCYSVQGNQHYIQLQKFLEKYDIPVSVGLGLLSGRNPESGGNGNVRNAFESGEFKVEHEELATIIMEKAKLFEAHSAWRTSSFVAAIEKLISAGKCNWNLLLKKFEEDPDALKAQSSSKQYITALEVIYNRRASIRKFIY